MDLKLVRNAFQSDGVFGTLSRLDTGAEIAVTLEHAYGSKAPYLPKLPPGTYQCVRGLHCLEGGSPFETFEITDVPGHSDILFHKGNVTGDSAGCVLLGSKRFGNWISHSKLTFDEFIDLQRSVDTFVLMVE